MKEKEGKKEGDESRNYVNRLNINTEKMKRKKEKGLKMKVRKKN